MTAESRPELRLNVVSEVSSVVDAEQREAVDWYNEQLRNLPEMKVEPFNLTGAGGWEAKFTPEGQVEAVTGRHFDIEGRKVTTPNFGWNQPVIVQRSEELITNEGEIDRISGIVLLLENPRGQIFVSVAQEPGIKAQTVEGKEIHPVVRTPFQASVEKLQQLASGNEEVDPILYGVLNILSKDSGRNLSSMVQDMPLNRVPTDGNRIDSNVLYGALQLTQEAANLVAEKVPQGRFLSPNQLKVLPLNGHLHIALSATGNWA
ncbi:MAG: hypothetical protein AAB600_01300 [Patescibacteria group bacterium]